jgi:hypothetical protein
MSWEEYCYASHGYFIRQARDREPLRIIAYILHCAHTDQKNRVSIQKFMPLVTDPKPIVETKEQKAIRMKERNESLKETLKKLNENSRKQAINGRGVKS